MVFEEKSMKDKLGRSVVFRNARPEDAGDLIQYLKECRDALSGKRAGRNHHNKDKRRTVYSGQDRCRSGAYASCVYGWKAYRELFSYEHCPVQEIRAQMRTCHCFIQRILRMRDWKSDAADCS